MVGKWVLRGWSGQPLKMGQGDEGGGPGTSDLQHIPNLWGKHSILSTVKDSYKSVCLGFKKKDLEIKP